MEAQPEGKLHKLLTVEQAAEHLALQPATVRGWLRSGVLRGNKLGRVWRISQTELLRIADQSGTSDKPNP